MVGDSAAAAAAAAEGDLGVFSTISTGASDDPVDDSASGGDILGVAVRREKGEEDKQGFT